MEKYPLSVEKSMKKFFSFLNERNKRIYSAIEAIKLGHGGITYISQVLGCDYKTVLRGIKDVGKLDQFQNNRIRKLGAGRKYCLDIIKDIDKVFLEVLKDYTAGDPMNQDIRWTNLTRKEISNRMKERDINISVVVVKQLLKKHGYVKRKAQKKSQ